MGENGDFNTVQELRITEESPIGEKAKTRIVPDAELNSMTQALAPVEVEPSVSIKTNFRHNFYELL